MAGTIFDLLDANDVPNPPPNAGGAEDAGAPNAGVLNENEGCVACAWGCPNDKPVPNPNPPAAETQSN